MYKIEMHCHTAEISRCARIPAKDLVDFYKQQGYNGIVITDHFLNGNTTVCHEESWEKRIELFTKGYENAEKRGKEVGLSVFFGWEFSFRGTDFLTYGLTKEWLLKNKDCDRLTLNDFADLVHKSGGFIVHAHPMREADYIDMIRLLPRKVDAVEVLNANRTDFENEMAEKYAQSYGLLKLCGSDNHTGMQPRLAALKMQERPETLRAIIEQIRNGNVETELYCPKA